MATRLGIELSAAACRLIEIDGRLRPGALDRPPRVRSFAVLPPSGSDTEAMLASLKGREAAVVVWGPASEHRQVVVTGASYESMRREAIGVLGVVGVRTSGALVDIAPVPGATSGRRPVVVALAASDEMIEAVKPLRAAGIKIRSLATPAMALASMAFMRRGVAAPNLAEAYIAVEEMATCIALMKDGALAIARELPWGYVDDGALRPLEDIATRLASEIRQYLDAVGVPEAGQVCICGGVPDLRTMSAMLTERMDVEVEPLDTLFGIDESRLPEPSDDFRDRVAELRPAWAAAADWPPHLNLLRGRHRARSKRFLAAAAIVAGVAAGVGAAWVTAHSGSAVTKPAPRGAMAQAPNNARGAPRSAVPPQPVAPVPFVGPQPVTSSTPAAPKPAPLLTSRSLVTRASAVTGVVRPPQPALTPTFLAALQFGTESTPSRVRPGSIPTSSLTPFPAPRQAVVPPPPVIARPTPPPPVIARREPQTPKAPDLVEAPQTLTAPQAAKPNPSPRPAPRNMKVEPVLPFDASLETILYSPDRKLAIIDSRIVGVGDLVKGARIVEITPTAVMLRDGGGRLRRLTLGAVGK